jgi:hypothetical protein
MLIPFGDQYFRADDVSEMGRLMMLSKYIRFPYHTRTRPALACTRPAGPDKNLALFTDDRRDERTAFSPVTYTEE